MTVSFPKKRLFPFVPGGFFFAKPMRENNYVTMMDPFQQKYGNFLSSALIFPALVADVLWVARTLVSLGKLLNIATVFGTIMCAHTMQPCRHPQIWVHNVHNKH